MSVRKHDIFRFRQFTLNHSRSTMPVSTDAVLLGAWSPVLHAQRVLDIGCGCGIIALMMAQRSNAEIHALDCDLKSVEEARLNIHNSPWSDRIQVYHSFLQDLVPELPYDLMICNPPFFLTGLPCRDNARTDARQERRLTLMDIFYFADRFLKSHGSLCIIFPFQRKQELLEKSEAYNLFVKNITIVYPNPYKEAKRILMQFVRHKPEQVIENGMIIETGVRHVYSDEYRLLTKAFYLE